MEKGKTTYTKEQIGAVIFCGIGCTLMAASAFFTTKVSLFDIGLASNGVGLFLFVFGKKADKASE
ncbi:MAG: hypothetical protein AAF655_19710 [Bacteroidota bacterium]